MVMSVAQCIVLGPSLIERQQINISLIGVRVGLG